MKTSHIATLYAPLFVSLLSGCASPGAFPSLAPRAIELNQGGAPTPQTSVLLVASDMDLVMQIDAASRMAEASVMPFSETLLTASKAIDANDGVKGSERWVAAQMALSELERQRTPAATALANLEDIMRKLVMGKPSVDLATAQKAHERVLSIYQTQTDAAQVLAQAINRR